MDTDEPKSTKAAAARKLKYRIAIQDLDTDPKPFSFSIPGQWLTEQLADTDLSVPTDAQEGSLRLTLSLSGSDVIVQGAAQACVAAPCDRCLEMVPFDLTADMTTLLTKKVQEQSKRGADKRGKKREALPTAEELAAFDPDDLDREYYEGDAVTFDTLVRENLVLELPMQVHCTQAECIARWEQTGTQEDPLSPFAELKKLKV